MPSGSQAPVVEIRGEGLASCACAALLHRKGLPLIVNRDFRPKLPAILTNRATQSLLRDIFGDGHLFDGLRQINQRIVAWGNSEAISIPHSAVVISEGALIESLWQRVSTDSVPESGRSEWVVVGSRAGRISTEERAFGSRDAIATPVELEKSAPRDACWIEAVSSGWLFVLPVGLSTAEESHAILIAVGNDTAVLLDESVVVRKVIAAERGGGHRVPCSPRISMALAGPGWIGCGTAAMSFDPLSGEGAGHAAREAILAAAVIDGVNRGLAQDRLLGHYAARLATGFRRHLEICLRFYTEACSSPWWEREIELLHEGISWCEANTDVNALREFQLVDFDLQPRG